LILGHGTELEYFVSLRLTKNGASRAAKNEGGHMNPLAWIPVAIAVLQVIKDNWDD